MNYENYVKKNYKELCVNPFCLNLRLPDELGLCNDCFHHLTKVTGNREIYDYSGKKPELKITLKEALEKLITSGMGGDSFRRLRFDDEPCIFCKEKQKRTLENINLHKSNSQKR